MKKNFFYEIKDKRVISRKCSNKVIKKRIKYENLYIHDFCNDKNIIINSFKNKVLIVPKILLNDRDYISADLFEHLETPVKDNKEIFENIVKNDTREASNYITFIIAITYTCNLHCSYCYQQNDKNLDKKLISKENLEKILDIIMLFKQENPQKIIEIGLFGGEPLLPQNSDIINKVLSFCVENKIKIHITTNGVYLRYFFKTLVIHRNLISSINTTIDSVKENYITRCSDKQNLAKETGSSMLEAIKLLLQYKVPVNVATNIDSHNVLFIKNIHDYFVENGFFDYSNFRWDIGRVDDRLYETNYSKIISETEILSELLILKDSKYNFHAAFMRSIQVLSKKIGLDFNVSEQRGVYNYCWASSAVDEVFYIDSDLDVFRCTCTVGRKRFSLFKFSLENLNKFKLHNRTYLDYNDCIKCKIGGFCSGGCKLSFDVDKEKQCEYEKRNFDSFIENIFIPHVKKLGKGYF